MNTFSFVIFHGTDHLPVSVFKGGDNITDGDHARAVFLDLIRDRPRFSVSVYRDDDLFLQYTAT